MLQRLLAFTVAVRDPQRSAEAYVRSFGWREAERGRIPRAVAQRWGAPRLQDARQVLIVAPTGDPAAIRFVEAPSPPAHYRPGLHLGWAAIELACRDPYALAARLDPAQFRIAVAPRPIPWNASIHAMQLLGPDEELLYLTKLPDSEPLLDLRSARSDVDRAFIAVLACRSLPDSLRWWREKFGLSTLPPSLTQIQIVNDRFALEPHARTPLGIVKLPSEFLLELDEYPAAATDRPHEHGALPPGVAMVSIESTQRDAHAEVIVGSANEWIEVLPCCGADWLAALRLD